MGTPVTHIRQMDKWKGYGEHETNKKKRRQKKSSNQIDNVWEAGEVEDIEQEVGNIAKRGAAGMVDKKALIGGAHVHITIHWAIPTNYTIGSDIIRTEILNNVTWTTYMNVRYASEIKTPFKKKRNRDNQHTNRRSTNTANTIRQLPVIYIKRM